MVSSLARLGCGRELMVCATQVEHMVALMQQGLPRRKRGPTVRDTCALQNARLLAYQVVFGILAWKYPGFGLYRTNYQVMRGFFFIRQVAIIVIFDICRVRNGEQRNLLCRHYCTQTGVGKELHMRPLGMMRLFLLFYWVRFDSSMQCHRAIEQ